MWKLPQSMLNLEAADSSHSFEFQHGNRMSLDNHTGKVLATTIHSATHIRENLKLIMKTSFSFFLWCQIWPQIGTLLLFPWIWCIQITFLKSGAAEGCSCFFISSYSLRSCRICFIMNIKASFYSIKHTIHFLWQWDTVYIFQTEQEVQVPFACCDYTVDWTCFVLSVWGTLLCQWSRQVSWQNPSYKEIFKISDIISVFCSHSMKSMKCRTGYHMLTFKHLLLLA